MAERYFDRLRGLIGRRTLQPGEAMLFPRCNDIHMWFMSVPLDVVFLREEKGGGAPVYRVTSIREGIRPWRPLPVRDGRADVTLELPMGSVQRCGIEEGDRLCSS
ncbi:MAG: DUF192 domain-containing protein [Oligoflexia bacterium]|nr:DUF192 domain-containing protein [Oligoflexia bacterium]